MEGGGAQGADGLENPVAVHVPALGFLLGDAASSGKGRQTAAKSAARASWTETFPIQPELLCSCLHVLCCR